MDEDENLAAVVVDGEGFGGLGELGGESLESGVDRGRLRKWGEEELGEAVGEGGEASGGVEGAVVWWRRRDIGERAADGLEGGQRGRRIVDGHCVMVGLCV